MNDINSIFMINENSTFTKVITNSKNRLLLVNNEVIDSVTNEVYYKLTGKEFKGPVDILTV